MNAFDHTLRLKHNQSNPDHNRTLRKVVVMVLVLVLDVVVVVVFAVVVVVVVWGTCMTWAPTSCE